MKSLNLKMNTLSLLCLMLTANYCLAQQGTVTINQDKKITTLVETKKEMNKNDPDPDRYKIQIYNGDHRSSAESVQRNFNSNFSDWKATLEYEPPNFKIWVGNFRTRLEADKALKKIKNKFPAAFIFKPKK